VKADDAPRIAELTRRLSEAEATIEALLSGQIDAVVDPGSRSPVLLAKAQQALRDERDRAQRYLDTADVILLALDVSGRVTQINRKGCDVLGWTERELVGRDFLEACIPARLRAATTTRFGEVVAGDLSVVEAMVLTKSGDERLIEWRNTLQYDRDGALVGTFSSGADVTDRSRALEALQTAEERTRFALEAASVGLWDLDRATGVVAWSAILEAQHGLAAGTFGRTMQAFMACIHPEDRASVVETIDRATRSGADFALHYRSLWPDGTVRWLSGAGRVVLDAQGGPVRAVGISMDVTERRALEEQYRQSQKMEAIGLLASGVAHDFNNLLTVILGFTELAAAEVETGSRQSEPLGEIRKAGERAAVLTRQLLAFSRRQVLEPKILDLNALITDLERMLRRLIGEDVELATALDPGVGPVRADVGQIEQVILNLAVNARDAMPTGGKLTIETRNVELDESYAREHVAVRPGSYAMLAVTDTGTGMSAETKSHMFEPFFTTKGQGKGTGLGLATVYGIVKQSEGNIWVYSELGRGATFKIYLPLVKSDSSPVEARPSDARPARGSETVLLVEDEDAVRTLTRRILEGFGYSILEARKGEAALELARRHSQPIHLLLTDVVMPDMGGPELAERMRRVRPDTKVLFMSGYTDDAVVRHGIIANGVHFLQKPFTPEALARKVRETLDHPQ
jgi:two-component system cell cycle sensor histidine kinase/response regulator CckA